MVYLIPKSPSLQGQHNLPDAYHRGRVPGSELQIYTWKDATLKELTNLIKDVYTTANAKGKRESFKRYCSQLFHLIIMKLGKHSR